MNRSCKQCSQQFVITDDDLAFLDKISPEFAGKKYQIPSPTICPQCRSIRRLCWRNERHLYKRKSDKTEKEIIAAYSPDKPYKVFENSEWHKDDWDPMSFGQEYNPSKSFFEQFDELLHAVPRQATNSAMLENSDYCNQTWQTKDSYLCFNVGYAERCFYCNEAFYIKDSVDCLAVHNCEFCYRCFNCNRCSNSSYLENCTNCSESHFSYDCIGCNNILLSANLRNKQFYIENKEYSKEEYYAILKHMNLGNKATAAESRKKLAQLRLEAIHKENNNVKTENCTGDYLTECKDCTEVYSAYKSEGCRRIINIDSDGKDCVETDFCTESELCYEGTSIAGHKNIFCAFIPYGDNNFYCNFCERCSNCFGCAGLKHKQYCVLNKQYTKDEYEKLVAKIIEKMKSDSEWGEFFPMKMSIFGYNETIAQTFYPKTKEGAQELEAKWQDNEYAPRFEGDYYEPKDDIEEYAGDEAERKKVLAGILKCEKSSKPFKIMPQELAFYIQNRIPIPRVHPDERYLEIFSLKNPMLLYRRQCMCTDASHSHNNSNSNSYSNKGEKPETDTATETNSKTATDTETTRCPNEFETTYAPDRPEKVYCESCYQKSVI